MTALPTNVYDVSADEDDTPASLPSSAQNGGATITPAQQVLVTDQMAQDLQATVTRDLPPVVIYNVRTADGNMRRQYREFFPQWSARNQPLPSATAAGRSG